MFKVKKHFSPENQVGHAIGHNTSDSGTRFRSQILISK